MSSKQFSNYVEAHNRKVSKDFEHTRAICYYVAASNRDPKKSFPSIQKFWPLPTDGDTMQKLDADRAAKIREMYDKAKQMLHG